MNFYYRLITFFIGALLGAILAVYFQNLKNPGVADEVIQGKPFENARNNYKTRLKNQGITLKPIRWDSLRYENISYPLESQILFEKFQILCVILLRNEKNLKAAKDTWTKGCNSVKVVNLVVNKKKIPAKRTKDKSSWVLLCKNLIDVPDSFKWILVVNDDTFAILENLRYFVATLNANKKYYLGHTVTFWGHDYNWGQAGYVLSKGSLKELKKLFKNYTSCEKDLTFWNKEDYYLGRQLEKLNISAADTRDEYGLSTFHPYNWYHVFFPGQNYYRLSKYPSKCCSKNSITFQAIEGDKMYTYYYIFYTLQLFETGKYGNQIRPRPEEDDKVWKQFLRERNMPTDNITSEQYYKAWEDLVDDPNSFAKNMKKELHVVDDA